MPRRRTLHTLQLLAMLLQIINSFRPLGYRCQRKTAQTLFSSSAASSNGTEEQDKKTLVADLSFQSELVEKKSRFLGFARRADSWEEARRYLESIKQQHPKARHWCFAYVGTDTERFSDDGEPSATAGAPILNAIHSQQLSSVMCVVVRYFGGIKLGKGGLIRAYGGTARQVLQDAETVTQVPMRTIRITVQASHIGSLYEVSGMLHATTANEVYQDNGSMTATVTCKASTLDNLQNKLTDATRGAVVFDES